MKRQILFFIHVLLLALVSNNANALMGSRNKSTLEVTVTGLSTTDGSDIVIPATVKYPDDDNTYTVTAIAADAFKGTDITSVKIPNTVTTIGDYAFDACYNLRKFVIADGTSAIKFGEYVFGDNDAVHTNFPYCQLTEVYLGRNIDLTGSKHPFSGINTMQKVTIGENVTEIPAALFKINTNSKSAAKYNSLVIPNSVIKIGNSAFEGTKIKSLTIGEGVTNIASKAFGELTKVIWLPTTAPTGYAYVNQAQVHYVPNENKYSFSPYLNFPNVVYECSYLSNSTVVDGIRYACNTADQTCCVIDCDYDPTVTTASIKTKVTYNSEKYEVNLIMPYACYGNPYFTQVAISNSGVIGQSAFSACKNLTDVYYRNVATMVENVFPSGITVHIYSNYLAAVKENNDWSDYIITDDFHNPEAGSLSTIVGSGPTELKVSGDLNGTDIKYLRKLMTDYSLAKLDLSDANIVAGGEAYYSSYYTTDNTIGERMFNMCSKIQELILPKSVTTIDKYTFRQCDALKKITIYAGTNNISYGIFLYSYGLESVEIEATNDSYTVVDNIIYTKDMKEVVACVPAKTGVVELPNTVTTLRNRAFLCCQNISTLVLPASLTKINELAFNYCGIKEVISNAIVPPVADYQAQQTQSIPLDAIIRVPTESIESYETANFWKDYVIDSRANVTKMYYWTNG